MAFVSCWEKDPVFFNDAPLSKARAAPLPEVTGQHKLGLIKEEKNLCRYGTEMRYGSRWGGNEEVQNTFYRILK